MSRMWSCRGPIVFIGSLLCVSIAFVSSPPRAGAEPLRISLTEAVERALRANLELLASAKDVEVAAAGVKRSSALLPSNPFLSLGASRRAETGGRPNLFAFLSQEFEVAGQRGPRIRAATHNLAQEQANLQQKQVALVAEVKSTFVRALAQRERARLLAEQWQLAQELAKANAPRQATLTERIEANNALLQATRYQRELWFAQREGANQLEALRRYLQLDAAQDVELVGELEPTFETVPSLADLVRWALSSRADVQAFQHALAAADAQLEVARRERIPNVTVSGSYSRFESSDFGGADVGVALPLFQTKDADIQEATAQRVRLALQLEDLQRKAEREVREAYRAYETSQREVDLFRTTMLPLAEENVRLQQRLLQRDEASAADLLNQKVELLEIRKDYVETLEGFHVARFDLERAVGGKFPESAESPASAKSN